MAIIDIQGQNIDNFNRIEISGIKFAGTNLFCKYHLKQMHLLKNYMEKSSIDNKIQTYVQQFCQIATKIKPQQIKHLKKNKREIFRDIEMFVYKHRKNNIKIENEYEYEQKKTEQKINNKRLDAMYIKLKLSYKDHDLDTTVQEIKQYRVLLKQFGYMRQDIEQQFIIIEKQYNKMLTFYSQFGGDWIFDFNEDGISLEHKVFQEEGCIAIKIETEINIQILPFLAILCEIDLHHNYIPFVYVSEQLKQMSRNQKAGYTKTYIPLISDRQTYFTAVGYDRMKTTGSIFLFTQNYDENIEFQKKYKLEVPATSDLVRCTIHYFNVQYIPLNRYRAKIKLAAKIDFKLSFLPFFILLKSAKIFTLDYFLNIVKLAKTYSGSKWEERVKKNPIMYDFFQQKIDRYFV